MPSLKRWLLLKKWLLYFHCNCSFVQLTCCRGIHDGNVDLIQSLPSLQVCPLDVSWFGKMLKSWKIFHLGCCLMTFFLIFVLPQSWKFGWVGSFSLVIVFGFQLYWGGRIIYTSTQCTQGPHYRNNQGVWVWTWYVFEFSSRGPQSFLRSAATETGGHRQSVSLPNQYLRRPRQ